MMDITEALKNPWVWGGIGTVILLSRITGGNNSQSNNVNASASSAIAASNAVTSANQNQSAIDLQSQTINAQSAVANNGMVLDAISNGVNMNTSAFLPAINSGLIGVSENAASVSSVLSSLATNIENMSNVRLSNSAAIQINMNKNQTDLTMNRDNIAGNIAVNQTAAQTAANINSDNNSTALQISNNNVGVQHDYISVLPTLANINANTQDTLASIKGFTDIQLSQSAKAMAQSGDSTAAITNGVSQAVGSLGQMALLAFG